MRAVLFLLLFIVSLSFVAALDGYASPQADVSIDDSLVVSDSVVYSNGFVSDDGQTWEQFSFAGQTRGNWIVGQASSTVRTDANYYALYSCSWNSGWSCSNSWEVYDQSPNEPVDQPVESNFTTTDSLQGDFEALQDLFEVTDGANWKDNTGWQSMTPETMSDAFGVEVWESGEHEGRVRVLYLFDNGLSNVQRDSNQNLILDDVNSGRYQLIEGMNLRESLGNLKQMEYIDIRLNTLSGTIPDSFWYLDNLKIAALGFSKGIDNRPNDIRELRSYSFLYPSKSDYLGNKFYGSVPPTVSNMESLEALVLERNYFDQTPIPTEVFQLPNIQRIDLSHNGHTGTLENVELGPELSIITARGGSFNRNRDIREPSGETHYYLSGELPPLWGNSDTISNIALSWHEFSGSIPSEWSQMSNMFAFYFEVNWGLDADINLFDRQNMPRLNTLRIARMNMTGSFDPDFAVADNNAVFSILSNKLSGELPDSFKYSDHPHFPTTMKIWALQGLGFSGPFSDDLSSLFQIRHVWGHSNDFSGPLPQDYPNATSLAQFYLSSNNFTGSIPATMGHMTSPHSISMSNNQLSSYERGAISPVVVDGSGDYVSGMYKLRSYSVSNNDLSQEDLDNVLLDLWANVDSRLGTEYENWGSSAAVGLSGQSTGAVPSDDSAVVSAISNLEAAGWEINTD